MKPATLLTLLTFFIFFNVFSQNRISVPQGKPIMIDGIFSDKEWDDGKTIITPDSIRLFFKQSKDYIFIGIQPPKEGYKGGWIDLYLSVDHDNIFNLHASRKLGERKLENGQWNQWEKWWTNEGSWRANYLRYDDVMEDGKMKTIQLKDEGWEYQIDKNKFAKGNWEILFDISVIYTGLKTVKYPSNASNIKTDDWLTITF